MFTSLVLGKRFPDVSDAKRVAAKFAPKSLHQLDNDPELHKMVAACDGTVDMTSSLRLQRKLAWRAETEKKIRQCRRSNVTVLLAVSSDFCWRSVSWAYAIRSYDRWGSYDREVMREALRRKRTELRSNRSRKYRHDNAPLEPHCLFVIFDKNKPFFFFFFLPSPPYSSDLAFDVSFLFPRLKRTN